MLKTTVYLSRPLKEQIERLAERTARSEAEVIRTALEEYAGRERPRPRGGIISVPPIEDWDEAMKDFGKD